MNNPAVNNETIVKYLLGSLPGAETERLDELSIADDEFVLALSAAEKDLVDAYLQGELTGAALVQFRSHYLASPLRRGRVDLAQGFGTLAVRYLASTEELASVRRSRKRSGWMAAKGFFTTPNLAWQWGFAVAAIAFLVAGSWLLSENLRLRRQLSQSQASPGTHELELQNEIDRQRQANAKTELELVRLRTDRERLEAELNERSRESQVANDDRSVRNQQQPSAPKISIASFVLTPQMRGVQQMLTISIPSHTDQVSIALELEPNEFRDYRVTLVDQAGNQTFWRSRQIKAKATDGGQALSVTFPAILLKPQIYALRVTGVSSGADSDIIGDYPFRVVKQ